MLRVGHARKQSLLAAAWELDELWAWWTAVLAASGVRLESLDLRSLHGLEEPQKVQILMGGTISI